MTMIIFLVGVIVGTIFLGLIAAYQDENQKEEIIEILARGIKEISDKVDRLFESKVDFPSDEDGGKNDDASIEDIQSIINPKE